MKLWEAANGFAEQQDYKKTLAALLNLWRLSGRTTKEKWQLARKIGYCLVSLGWRQSTAIWLKISADSTPNDRRSDENVTNDYEVAGLLYLEMKSGKSVKPCFRQARALSELHNASRCYVLENEALRLSTEKRKRLYFS